MTNGTILHMHPKMRVGHSLGNIKKWVDPEFNSTLKCIQILSNKQNFYFYFFKQVKNILSFILILLEI